MTDLSMHLHDLTAKEAEQAKIDADKAAFFARGGQVTVVEPSNYDHENSMAMRVVLTKQIDEVKARHHRQTVETEDAARGSFRRTTRRE